MHDHSGSLTLGLWIIAGLLCFLILEKIFSEEERIQEQQEQLEKLQELKVWGCYIFKCTSNDYKAFEV